MSSAGETPLLSLLSDDPIREIGRDGLGLANWARVVAGAALGSQGPLTIGVFGRWGMGKTSLLHLARGLIERRASEGRVTTVLFNAWQHEREENPLVPLVASILEELEAGRAVRKGRRADLAAALRAVLYGLTAEIKGGVPWVGEAGLKLDSEKAQKRYDELRSSWIEQQVKHSPYYNAFRALREAQRDAPDEARHRVVVLVDDLDRCLPEQAVRLLESIKLVLNEPGFIFVIAVDRDVLDAYLDKRFSDSFGPRGQERGQSYLAKFVQLPLWLPSHEETFEGLVRRLLDEPGLAPHRQHLAPLAREIALACGYNPRQLIRLLNEILVERFVHNETRGEFPFRTLLVLRGIRLHSKLVYTTLQRNPNLCELLQGCAGLDQLRERLASELTRQLPGDLTTDVLLRIQDNEELIQFLASAPAQEWLGDHRRRGAVKSFLESPEEEEEEWQRERVERALEELRSEDKKRIIAGCQLLAHLTNPQRVRTVPLLASLVCHPDQQVAREAKWALDRVCASLDLSAAASQRTER